MMAYYGELDLTTLRGVGWSIAYVDASLLSKTIDNP